MPGRRSSTGRTFEDLLRPVLANNGYVSQFRTRVGTTPNGRSHIADVLVTAADGTDFLVSVKWQQTSGTAEEKVPYEYLKLKHALDTALGPDGPRFRKAYLVLGGEGWTMRELYTGGWLEASIPTAGRIQVITLEQFIALANRRML